GNQILQSNEPWKKIETEKETVKVTLNLCVQICAALSIAMRPFMPFTSDRLRAMLNLPAIKDHRELVEVQNKLAGGKYLVKAGHIISEPEQLFSRIPDEKIKEQIDKLTQAMEQQHAELAAQNGTKVNISFDDFTKCDIRTGTVMSAE